MIVLVGMWSIVYPMGKGPMVKRNLWRKPYSWLSGKCRLRFCKIWCSVSLCALPPPPTETWFSGLASLFQFDTLPPVLEIFQKHRVLVLGLLLWITVFLSRLRVLSILCSYGIQVFMVVNVSLSCNVCQCSGLWSCHMFQTKSFFFL